MTVTLPSGPGWDRATGNIGRHRKNKPEAAGNFDTILGREAGILCHLSRGNPRGHPRVFGLRANEPSGTGARNDRESDRTGIKLRLTKAAARSMGFVDRRPRRGGNSQSLARVRPSRFFRSQRGWLFSRLGCSGTIAGTSSRSTVRPGAAGEPAKVFGLGVFQSLPPERPRLSSGRTAIAGTRL